jgi:aspartate ammonia-lyase
VARKAAETRKTIREIVLSENVLTEEAFNALITPEAVCRLGSPDAPHNKS